MQISMCFLLLTKVGAGGGRRMWTPPILCTSNTDLGMHVTLNISQKSGKGEREISKEISKKIKSSTRSSTCIGVGRERKKTLYGFNMPDIVSGTIVVNF